MFPIRILALATLALAPLATAPSPPQGAAPELEDAIRALAAAADEGGQRRALAALSGVAPARLLPALLEHALQATDTRDAMLPGYVVEALAIPPAEVIGALIPLLDGDDASLRAAADNVLGEYEDRSASAPARFEALFPWLTPEPAAGLVRHMVEVDPLTALDALARTQLADPGEAGALRRAARVLSATLWRVRTGSVTPEALRRSAPEALEGLDALARNRRPWARQCAVPLLVELRPASARARLERLADDRDPGVAAAARRALEGLR